MSSLKLKLPAPKPQAEVQLRVVVYERLKKTDSSWLTDSCAEELCGFERALGVQVRFSGPTTACVALATATRCLLITFAPKIKRLPAGQVLEDLLSSEEYLKLGFDMTASAVSFNAVFPVRTCLTHCRPSSTISSVTRYATPWTLHALSTHLS